jgi:hypothetical protein
MENEGSLMQEMLSEEIKEVMEDIIICVGALTQNVQTISKTWQQTAHLMPSPATFARKI